MLKTIELKISHMIGERRWNYLRLVSLLVRRELKVKYRGTVLGYLWSMLNPLLFMIVISIVFSSFVRDIPNYHLFVLSGILAWNMASLTMLVGVHSIVSNASLLRKVKIPIWVFPLVPLGTAATNLLLSLIPYAIIFKFADISLSSELVYFPLIMLIFMTFLAGVALILATLNVFFRDVSHVLDPILSLVFYASPIIYDRNGPMIDPTISRILGFNPFTHFIEAFRATIFGNAQIDWNILGLLALLAVSSLSLGTILYKMRKHEIIFRL